MTDVFVPRHVNQLELGTEFRSGDVKYKLIHFNDCRAYVQILSNKRAAITKKDKDGNETVLAEFDAPGAKVNISPMTELDEVLRTPAEIEWDSVKTVTSSDGTKVVVKSTRVKGQRGKDALDDLKRPVNPNKKIGQMVSYLMEKPQTIKDIMSKFEITHGCSLSYLFVLNRDYGFGYSVENETATLIMPTNCKDPFKGAKEKKNEASESRPTATKPVSTNDEVRHPTAPAGATQGRVKPAQTPAKAVRRKSTTSGGVGKPNTRTHSVRRKRS